MRAPLARRFRRGAGRGRPAPGAVLCVAEARSVKSRASLGECDLQSAPPAVALTRLGRAVHDLELLQAPAGADRDAGERGLGQLHGHLGLLAKPLDEAGQERTAAGEDDAPIHDVGSELRRGLVQGRLDGVEDLAHRLVEGAAHLLGRDHDGLGEAREHVAAADFRGDLLVELPRRADLELQLLRRLLADEELVLLLHVAHDRLVHLVAADADGLGDDDAAEGDDGHLGRSAADVHDHVPGRLRDRQAGADRRRHGLLDQVRLAGAGGQGCLLDGALLHARDAARDAHDDAWVGEAVVVHLLDEVAEHLLGDVEVGDDPVLERTDGRDRAGRPAEHPLRLDADGVDLAGALVDGDHGRLGEHDPAPADVHERVRSAEVDSHLATAEAAYVAPEAHSPRSVYVAPARPYGTWPRIWPHRPGGLTPRMSRDANERGPVPCTAAAVPKRGRTLARCPARPVIETKEATLSAGMQSLNSRYAEWFNRRHRLKGHLFQGRFHSVLVESTWHLLELSRYISLNPVRAGLCVNPAHWRWSSYRAVAGLGPAPPFLAAGIVLEHFGCPPSKARLAFRRFVCDGLPT